MKTPYTRLIDSVDKSIRFCRDQTPTDYTAGVESAYRNMKHLLEIAQGFWIASYNLGENHDKTIDRL